MKLKALRNFFNSELKGYYPDTEISSFFHILSNQFLKLNRIDIALNLNTVITGNDYDKFQDAIESLKNYTPIQYITGEEDFYSLTIKVNNNVLIPRPETEELVDWVHNSVDKNSSLKILDIGTGSGCIAISIAKNLPNSKVYALDVSPKALIVAKENAELNNVQLEFIEADILKVHNIEDNFDIIISNPPYVRQSEKTEMKSNVLDNEPHIALFVDDEDALQFYKSISQFAVNNLSDNGLLFFEINEYLGDKMKELLKANNFKKIELKQDLFGKDRMIKAIK